MLSGNTVSCKHSLALPYCYAAAITSSSCYHTDHMLCSYCSMRHDHTRRYSPPNHRAISFCAFSTLSLPWITLRPTCSKMHIRQCISMGATLNQVARPYAARVHVHAPQPLHGAYLN
jgi:hypothetical protein